ncbi:CbtA family protein [Methylocapsa aurea]|uniref:CbtA family protein n=1 Tax=Methylocapsa aurea TaxID=663610 RepID=UPI00055FE024|nr:CbtA family protein [Methylocapsa aurea]
MVGGLLLRGMLAGILAGFLAAAFATFAGEPSIERAIAFEAAVEQAEGQPSEPEIVSRETQRSVGLFTAAMIYGAAVGGFFGLAFAFAYGRIGGPDPRAVAAILACAGFIAIGLVPELKYPANPPAIGAQDTLGARTALFFVMMLISVLAMVLAAMIGETLRLWLDSWNAALAQAAVFIAMVGLAARLLPSIDEVPASFPADVLWSFRVSALGVQAVLWSALGLGFGALTQAHPIKRR